LPGLTAPQEPLAFKAQQAQEQQVQPELPVRVSRVLPAQLALLAWEQLESKGQLERPARTVPLELQGQEQLVPRALQEPG
jgi:hypothetical protein